MLTFCRFKQYIHVDCDVANSKSVFRYVARKYAASLVWQ